MRDIKKHIAAEGGSAKLAIQNIICHLDLLTDEQKAAINWHPEQSVSLAVMRLIAIDEYRNVGVDGGRSELSEASVPSKPSETPSVEPR